MACIVAGGVTVGIAEGTGISSFTGIARGIGISFLTRIAKGIGVSSSI